MIIGKYKLINEEKVDRALNGTVVSGSRKGGVARPDGSYDDAAVLAAYDRLGGYIQNAHGSKVKTGSFYDFVARKPRQKPEVVLIFNINGEIMEVGEDEELPDVLKAAQLLENKKKGRKTKAKKEDETPKKSTSKKKASDDEEEEEEEL